MAHHPVLIYRAIETCVSVSLTVLTLPHHSVQTIFIGLHQARSFTRNDCGVSSCLLVVS